MPSSAAGSFVDGGGGVVSVGEGVVTLDGSAETSGGAAGSAGVARCCRHGGAALGGPSVLLSLGRQGVLGKVGGGGGIVNSGGAGVGAAAFDDSERFGP